MGVSKLNVCCLEGEEGKAALGEERKAGGALFEVSKADVSSKCCLPGICCCRDSPCSSAPGYAGGASLYSAGGKGSPSGDTLSLSAPCNGLPSCLHVTWGGSWTLPELSHMGC